MLAYKRKRNIINRAYQTQVDNVVGKMTIASLDAEMLTKESSSTKEVLYTPSMLWRPFRLWQG